MQTLWKGSISFGLVSVPVRLQSAISQHKVRLHEVHLKDGGQVRHRRVCEVCGEQLQPNDIGKGFEDEEGALVPLDPSDLADLPVPSRRMIDLLAFVDADELDPLLLAKPYYLSPEKPGGDKPYVLFRETLKAHGKVAIAKITLQSRESLAVMRVHEDILVVQTMYWPDEVNSAAGLAPPDSVTVRPQELKMAGTLMETYSEDFDIAEVEDEYQSALAALIEARIAKRPAPTAEEPAPAPDNVVDITDLLQASIEAHGGAGRGRKKTAASRTTARTATPESAAGTRKRTPKKAASAKTAAKSGAAKTAAAKKAPAAKKAAGRKRPSA